MPNSIQAEHLIRTDLLFIFKSSEKPAVRKVWIFDCGVGVGGGMEGILGL